MSSGGGIVCTEGGEDYYDLQGDHITEGAMLKAVADFGADPELGESHQEMGKGTVLFSFPLTADVQKAYGITCDKTGWMVGVKPNDPAMVAKFADGTYTGFSIGGLYGQTEEVAE